MTGMGGGASPGGAGGFKIADAFVNIAIRDQASGQVSAMMAGAGRNVASTTSIIQSNVGRMSQSLRGLTGVAAEPLFQLMHGFEGLGEAAEGAGGKLTAAGVGMAAAGAALLLMGAREKQATDQLNLAINNSGNIAGDYAGKIDQVVKSQENLGNNAITTKDALTTLTNATNDPTKAMELMGEAADLAAVRHISLSSAASLVARGLAGSGRVFKQFGIQVKYNADGTKDYAAANQELADKIKGQAAAQVDNFTGKLKILAAHIEDAAAAFGQKFGPQVLLGGAALTAIGSIMQIRAAKIAAAAAESAAAQRAGDASMITSQEALTAAIAQSSKEIAISTDYILTALTGMSVESIAAYRALATTAEATAGQVVAANAEIATSSRVAGASAGAGAGGAAAAGAVGAGAAGGAGARALGAGEAAAGSKSLLATGAGFASKAATAFALLGPSLVGGQTTLAKELVGAYEGATKSSDKSADAIFKWAATAKGLDGVNLEVTDSTKKFGLSTDQLATGVGGTDDQYKKFIGTLKEHGKVSKDDQHALDDLHKTFKQTSPAAQEAANSIDALNMSDQATTASMITFATKMGLSDKQAASYLATLGIVADKNGDFAQSNQEVEKSLAAVAHAYGAANTAGQGYLDSVAKFAQSSGSAADRAALIGSTLVAANGDYLSFTKSLAEPTKAIHALDDAFKKQADDILSGSLKYKDSERAAISFTGTGKKMKASIDANATGASDLIDQLQGLQTAAMDAAEGEYQHNVALVGGKKAADDAYNTYYSKTYKQLMSHRKELGLNTSQVHALAQQIFGLPADTKAKIEQEGAESVTSILENIELTMRSIAEHKSIAQIVAEDQATGTLNSVEQKLWDLEHQPHIVTITTVQHGTVQSYGTNATNVGTSATGGTVMGPGPRGVDSALYLLAPGEEVINTKQADKHRTLLKAINAGAYGMASGGTAGWQPGSPYPTGPAPASSSSSSSAKSKSTAKTASNLVFKLDSGDFPTLMKDLFGSVSTLTTATHTLLADTRKGVQEGMGGASIIKTITTENTKLIKLANERAVIATKLKTANTNLTNLQKQYNDEAAKVAQATMSSFDISSSGAGATGGSLGNLIASLQVDVKKAGDFKTELASLSQMGLNKTLYQQLAEAGPGSANTQALAHASKADIAQINSLYGQLSSLGTGTGSTVANAMYGQGIAAAKGIVAGLNSQEKSLEKTMTKLADVMVGQIKKDLKIHSPSQVGHDIGNMFGEGIGMGMDTHQTKLQARATKLSNAMTKMSIPGAGYDRNGGGIIIEKFILRVDEIKDVQHLLKIIHGIPQAVRAGAGGH